MLGSSEVISKGGIRMKATMVDDAQVDIDIQDKRMVSGIVVTGAGIRVTEDTSKKIQRIRNNFMML